MQHFQQIPNLPLLAAYPTRKEKSLAQQIGRPSTMLLMTLVGEVKRRVFQFI